MPPDQRLVVLGEALGPIYTALVDEVIWIHAKWLEFRKLLAKSPERIDLLNESAGFFLCVVQDVLWDDVLLHLTRLTDPPKSAGKENLTIRWLPTLIDDRQLACEVGRLVDVAVERCAFARDRRNRSLAHSDLRLALQSPQAQELAPASRETTGNALAAIAAVLNRIEGRYFDSEVAFGHFVAWLDADQLVYHLGVASHYEEGSRRRLQTGHPLPEDLESPPQIQSSSSNVGAAVTTHSNGKRARFPGINEADLNGRWQPTL